LFLQYYLVYFAFISTLLLASELSMLVTSIQFGSYFLGCELSIVIPLIEFGSLYIYPCLTFRMWVINSCHPYLIWLTLHLLMPYF